jgi:glycosidase
MTNKYLEREKDWHIGATVYQVIVDRFSPSSELEQKKQLYSSPLRLKKWHQLPTRGKFNDNAGAWQHELDFWGGDLSSLQKKLDYLQRFNVDILYLNPIFKSLTNHKYDTHDYFQVDPVYGSETDLKKLVQSAHKYGMKVILDGVFNHVGRKSNIFVAAQKNVDSSFRRLFRFSGNEPVCWNNVYNLPELDLNNKETREYLYAGKNSVVKHWLQKFDIDGWRLDVAYEFGPKILAEITAAARAAKPDAMVIGEIWNYPEFWYPSVDGVINLHARAILLRMLGQTISAEEAMRMYRQMLDDAGIDHILRAWLTLDNHDTPRLASVLKSGRQQALARILQFTLPGSVGLYYGSEFALKGVVDPQQRATMPWHQLEKKPAILLLHEKLAHIRKSCRALRIGDFKALHAGQTFSFMRTTERVGDTMIVCANPSAEKKAASIQIRDGRIHDYSRFTDLLTGKEFSAHSGFLDVEIAPVSALVMRLTLPDPDCGYSRYKHME